MIPAMALPFLYRGNVLGVYLRTSASQHFHDGSDLIDSASWWNDAS